MVNVRNAKSARLDIPAIRHGLAEHDLYLQVRGIGLSGLFGEEIVDLKQNFYAHRGWFFSLAFANIVVSVCKDVVLDGTLPHPTNLAFHAVFGVTLLIGAPTPRERYHKALVVFGIAAFVLYIILLYARMQ